MKEVAGFLGVATLGCVIYHLGQKTVSHSANPMVVLMGVYLAAFAMALLAAPLFRSPGQAMGLRQMLSWPVLVVGIGVILIEGGFLLAYRSGGSLQWSGVAVNGIAAIVLLPVAILVFREKVTITRLLGIALTLGGMGLIARK